MAWDYKNPTPPEIGDGRYERKYPNSYPVLDILRVNHYDMFGSDLNFNGNKNSNYFGCCETDIMAYYNTCKQFAGQIIDNKSPLFTVATERGKVGEQNQYFEFDVKKEIFTGEMKRDVLEYIKVCINKLVGRDFNLVLSDDDVIKFIHVPFERQFYGLGEFGVNYTTNEFARYLRMYYEHIYTYVEYVDSVIKAGLEPHEKEWVDKIMDKKEDKKDDIEIGPKLAYINITPKCSND